MKNKDLISFIEAGYSLEKDDESWTKGLLEQVDSLFERGWGATIFSYQYTSTTLHIDDVATRAPSFFIGNIRKNEKLPSEVIDALFRAGNNVGTVSDLVFSRFPEQLSAFRKFTRGMVGDSLGMTAHSGCGRAISLSVGFFKQTTPTTSECKRWPAIASHLGAGLRLRKIAQSFSLDVQSAEAIFDPWGKLQHAKQEAAKPEARDILRDAVRRVDHLRTRVGRKDPAMALEAWEGLVGGHWSLVDYFDSDRRRFVVAIKNDPQYPDPRGLTMRERQVAEFVGLGQSCKEISYTLGVSPSAVTNCTARAQHKLGLSSLPELAAFFASNGLRTKMAEVSVKGEELLVGAYPLIDEKRVSVLTDTERTVLAHLLAGSTNSNIAQRRHTSESTVANQVQSIFRKLGVASRSELAARLQGVV